MIPKTDPPSYARPGHHLTGLRRGITGVGLALVIAIALQALSGSLAAPFALGQTPSGSGGDSAGSGAMSTAAEAGSAEAASAAANPLAPSTGIVSEVVANTVGSDVVAVPLPESVIANLPAGARIFALSTTPGASGPVVFTVTPAPELLSAASGSLVSVGVVDLATGALVACNLSNGHLICTTTSDGPFAVISGGLPGA